MKRVCKRGKHIGTESGKIAVAETRERFLIEVCWKPHPILWNCEFIQGLQACMAQAGMGQEKGYEEESAST